MGYIYKLSVMKPEKLCSSSGILTYEWHLEQKDTTKLENKSKDISTFCNGMNQLKCLDSDSTFVGQNGQKFLVHV